MTSNHPPLHTPTPYLPFLLLTLLFALRSHPASLPPPISISNTSTTLSLPTLPNPQTAGRDIECFNLTTPKAYPVDLSECPAAIDLLYHDPTGVMTLQRFSRLTLPPPRDTFFIPYAWQFGACQVVLTSGAMEAVDTFRLADVIFKAERIMAECPPKSKKALGGIALVGHGESFFVAVNGPDLAPDGEGEEGEEGGGEREEEGR